jgi:hypothetical protein
MANFCSQEVERVLGLLLVTMVEALRGRGGEGRKEGGREGGREE